MQNDVKWRVKVLETHGILSLLSLLAGLFTGQRVFFWGAALLLGVSLFARPIASWIADLWLRFAGKLAAVNSTIILTLLYYLILTPVALLYRRFVRNDSFRIPRSAGTFYYERNHDYQKTDLEKMW